MLKKALITTFICFCLGLVIFHQAFFSNASGWMIKLYTYAEFGEALHYEKVTLDGNKIIVDHPTLYKKKQFEAQKILISYDMDWWARRLNLSVEVEKPVIVFKNEHSQEKKLKSFLSSKSFSLFDVHYLYKIKDGTFEWVLDDPIKHSIAFDLEFDSVIGGLLNAHFNGSDSNTNYFSLWASSSDESMVLEGECHHVSSAEMVHLASLIFPELNTLKIESGFAQGHMRAVFPEIERPYIEGQLTLDDFSFTHPQSNLQGIIKKSVLKIDKNYLSESDSSIIAQLEIVEDAQLINLSNQWKLDHIKGDVHLDPYKNVIFKIASQGSYKDLTSLYNIHGEASLSAKRPFHVDINLISSSTNQKEGSIKLLINQPKGSSKIAEVECHQLSYVECGFIETLLSTYWPQYNKIEFLDGVLNAQAHMKVSKKGIERIECTHLDAKNLKCDVPLWNMAFSFPMWTGHGVIDLSQQDIWHSLNAELNISNGQICWNGLKRCPLDDIQAHVSIENGEINHSVVKMRLAELKGIVDIEWLNGKQLMTAKLDGKALDLAEIFPPTLQKGIIKHFPDNQLGITASIIGYPSQIKMEGVVTLEREPNTKLMDLIHFGYEMKKDEAVPSGWFYAKNLPLNKYLSPYVFKNGLAEITGVGEFSGSFNHEKISINYNADGLKIENKDFLIDAGEIPHQIGKNLSGYHVFDLKNGTHEGSFPFKNGSYLEKNTGLLFEAIHSQVCFKDMLVSFKSFEASYEGIKFGGEIELDNADPAPGVFTLAMSLPFIHGKISKLRELLLHLKNPPDLANLPLEGDLEAIDQGLKLKFDFIPKDFHVSSHFIGQVSNGTFPFSNFNLSLADMTMNVEYIHENESLNFSEIQGTLLVGKPHRVKEFLVSGDHIRIKDHKKQNIDIDLEVTSPTTSLLRIVAQTQTNDHSKLVVQLDKTKSHFFGIFPLEWDLTLNDWSHLNSFHMEAPFHLEDIWGALYQSIIQTSLFIPTVLSDKAANWKEAKGDFILSLNYEGQESDFNYKLLGTSTTLNQSEYGSFLFEGKKQGEKWKIDQFRFGKISLGLDLHHQSDLWNIDSFVLNYGPSLLIGLEGTLNEKNGQFEASINLMEGDLKDLNHFSFLQTFVQEWQPAGKFKGKGFLKIVSLDHHPWIQIDANINTHLNNFSLNQFSVPIDNVLNIIYKNDHSLEINNVHVNLLNSNDWNDASITLKKLYYKIIEDQIGGVDLSFNVSNNKIETLGKKLQQHFPQYIDSSFLDSLNMIKGQTHLAGTLKFEKGPQIQRILVGLQDGNYFIKNKKYDLKEFQLELTPNKLSFSGFSKFERLEYRIIGEAVWPNLDKGTFVLYDQSKIDHLVPLTINWKNQSPEGFKIERIQGYFSGLNFSLSSIANHSKPGWTILNGDLYFDPKSLDPILSKGFAEKIQEWELTSNLGLSGTFWVNHEGENDLLDNLFFEGNLLGQDVTLKGYLIEKIRSEINYSSGKLEAKEMTFSDPAGSVLFPQILLNRDQNNKEWLFTIPKTIVKDLQPNLLRDLKDPSPSKFKSLVIRRIELEDFTGSLETVSSWNAKGYLHFLNPSKKNIYNAILAIPAEIILRLGLDPQVLNPVTGTVIFNLEGDKFYLKKLKDVYSEGRGSKFYLANSSQPSWMDLKGNLFVQIRMKQYNLIFKLAELFTVSVQGTIKKPTYSLMRNEKG